MLGRRAAIGTSIAVLAVAGGGGAAIAAAHGSSGSAKPVVNKVVRQHVPAKAHVLSVHHCHHPAEPASATASAL
jgi:hypothetical protein